MSFPPTSIVEVTTCDLSTRIVAIDHPSLHDVRAAFVGRLRDESRRFDRAGISNPKPFPSLVRKVTDPQRRRFGAMDGAELVGMASLASDGEIAIAVVAARRGQGFGAQLLEHLAVTAERDGYERLVLESTRRSRPIAQLGERFGWTTQVLPHGRIELTLQLRQPLTS